MSSNRATEVVSKWPAWKRDVKLTKYSSGLLMNDSDIVELFNKALEEPTEKVKPSLYSIEYEEVQEQYYDFDSQFYKLLRDIRYLKANTDFNFDFSFFILSGLACIKLWSKNKALFVTDKDKITEKALPEIEVYENRLLLLYPVVLDEWKSFEKFHFSCSYIKDNLLVIKMLDKDKKTVRLVLGDVGKLEENNEDGG